MSLVFCELLSSGLHNAQLVRTLADLAIIDPLTQIFNRRHLFERLDAAMTQARRQSHPLSVAMVDIDHFKRVNDSYGHVFGDEVLRTVADALRNSIRAGVDIPARYGGEEFLLIMPFTGLDVATDVANRIGGQIKALRVKLEGLDLSVTCSFGVAEYAAGESQEQLLNRADSALYRAKKTGRDRVCAASL